MAKVGGGAAYQRLTKPEDGLSQSAQFWGAIDARKNAAHKLRQEREQVRKQQAESDKKRKAKQGINRAKGLKLYDTGSDSLNETLAETITIATNEYPKIFEILDDDTGKYSQAEKIKAKLKYDNILNLPENLKTMTNAVMGEYQQYQKGVEEGSIFRDEDYEEKFENGFKGVSLSFDDDGLPVAIFKKGQQDINGDGIINELDIETMGSLNDVFSRPQFQKKYDFDSIVDEHSKRLVSRVDTKSDGFRSTKTTGLDLNLLNKTTDRALYVDDQPSDLMMSFARTLGLDANNPDHQKKIESDYKNELLIRSRRGVEEKFNASAFISNKRENRLSNDTEISLGEPVTPTSATWGKQFKNIDSNKVNSVPVNNVKIDAIPLADGRTITDAEVVNLTYDKNGNMLVDVVYTDTKSSKFSAEEIDELRLDLESDDEKVSKDAELKLKSINKGAQKKKEQVTISKENESKIANSIAGGIEEAKKLVYKNEEDANKKSIEGF